MLKQIGYILGFLWDGHIRTGSVNSFISQLRKHNCSYVEAVSFTQEKEPDIQPNFWREEHRCLGFFAAQTTKGRVILLKREYGNKDNICMYAQADSREEIAQRYAAESIKTDVAQLQEAVPSIKVKLVDPDSYSNHEQPSFERLKRLRTGRCPERLRTGLVGLLGG